MLRGATAGFRLFILLAPHIGNCGAGNTAWVADWKGTPMLFAERDGNALALACSAPWLARSVGFVGASDGWQDLVRHKVLAWRYERVENGIETRDTGLGVHVADLPTDSLSVGATVRFTFRWPLADRWEGTDVTVMVV